MFGIRIFGDLQYHRIESSSITSVSDIFLHNLLVLDVEDFYVECNGKTVDSDTSITNGCIYNVLPRLKGGKGGFGSMLRSIGAQIEKTTNREACRDLSGRRMRDVNNEKKLKDWVAKAAERDREKEEKRRERIERRKTPHHYKFDDPTYEEQKSTVIDNLDDALRTGLKKTSQSTSEGLKRPSSSGLNPSATKKPKAEWLGLDIDTDESSDDDDAESSSIDKSNASSDETCNTTSATCTSQNKIPEVNASRKNTDEISQGNKAVEPVTNEETPPSQSPQTSLNDNHEKKEVNLDEYSSVKELELLGLEVLKQALISRGLKCGGTLDERATRLYSVKGLSSDEIDPSLKSKAKKGQNVKGKKP